MTRRPGDTEPEPPGGRAAARLREFMDQRFPGGLPPKEEADDRGDEQDEEREPADREDE